MKDKRKAKLIAITSIVIISICSLLMMINYVFWGIDFPLPSITQKVYPASIIREKVDNILIVSLPENGLIIEMVQVPGGKYLRENDGSQNISGSYQEIFLDEFWIDRYEVTNEQFSAFIAETSYKTVIEKEDTGRSKLGWGQKEPDVNWRTPQGEDSNILSLSSHPVVQVSWYDAVAYCEWRQARLPTEAEWEKAAYGVTGTVYPWGNEFDSERLNYCNINCVESVDVNTFDDQYEGTVPVGTYKNGTSYFGAFEMAGNVNEWVIDWYSDAYYKNSPSINPQGPNDKDVPNATLLNHMNGGAKVTRGGSWRESENFVGSNFRNSIPPELGSDDLGFRCAYSSH